MNKGQFSVFELGSFMHTTGTRAYLIKSRVERPSLGPTCLQLVLGSVSSSCQLPLMRAVPCLACSMLLDTRGTRGGSIPAERA